MRSSRLAEQEYTIAQNNARIDELTEEAKRSGDELLTRRARYQELLARKNELEHAPSVPIASPQQPLKSALKFTSSAGSQTQAPGQVQAITQAPKSKDLATTYAELTNKLAESQSSAQKFEAEIAELKVKVEQIKHRRFVVAQELHEGCAILEADMTNLAEAGLDERGVPLQCLRVLQDIDLERERDALATRRELRELGMETSIKDRRVQELMLEAEERIRVEEMAKDKEIKELHDEVFNERSALQAELEELRKSNQIQVEELRKRVMPPPVPSGDAPASPEGKASPKKTNKNVPILQERRKRREDIERIQKALKEERKQLQDIIANAGASKKKLDQSKLGHDTELKKMENHIAIAWKESGNAP